MRKNVRILFFLPFFWGLFIFQKQPPLPESYIGRDPSAILAAMPEKDRDRLEYFFKELIIWDGFGYVLFGEKPMALGGQKKYSPFESFSAFKQAFSPRQLKSILAFQAWKKYEKFFPMNHFTLVYENTEDNDYIILINNTSFVRIIQEHAKDFNHILHQEIKSEKLLKEALHNPLISEILQNHDGLIGILLGYGRDNAFLFHQRAQLKSEEEMAHFCDQLHLDSPWTDEEFQEFSEKFRSVSWISMYITGSHMKEKGMELVALPGFLADPTSSETQYWREEYLKTRQAIIDYYKGKDFLETRLRLLTS